MTRALRTLLYLIQSLLGSLGGSLAGWARLALGLMFVDIWLIFLVYHSQLFFVSNYCQSLCLERRY